ncbi:MAG: GAF domain-containing protein [Actinomycetota bacterium]|nr:GAF domain-containing protein [Actinomycetota bacterium]
MTVVDQRTPVRGPTAPRSGRSLRDRLSHWPGHRRSTDLFNALAVAAAVAAYLFAALAGDADGNRRVALLGLGALTAAVVVVVNLAIQRRDRRRIRSAEDAAVEAQEALTTTLNGALAPITSYLGEMGVAHDHRERAAIGGKLRQAVVDAAVRLTGPASRSAFYRLDDATGWLVLDVYGGRSALPRDHFITGDEAGDVLIDLVARGDLVFIPDVEVDRLVRPTSPGEYATVIGVAVTAGPTPLGLLTVDAPVVGDLTTVDVELVRVLANLLGSGLVQEQAATR